MLVAVMGRAIFWSFFVMARVLQDWDLGMGERVDRDLDWRVDKPLDRDFFLNFFFFFFFLRYLRDFQWQWRWRCGDEEDEVLELALDVDKTLESSLLLETELSLESAEGSDHSSELVEEVELELELLEELSEGLWPGGGLRLFLDENFDCGTVFALDLATAFLINLDRFFPAGDRLESASSSELSLEQSIERGTSKPTFFVALFFCSCFGFCFYFFFFFLVIEADSHAAASCWLTNWWDRK